MSLITIFSTPKPFTDPFFATIQRNAIQTWKKLGPEVEVMLVGDEPGIEEVANDLSLLYVPEVERNEWGTPLVRSLFEQARQACDSPMLAIVNADILLFPDFLDAAKQIARLADKFIMVGRRWGLDIDQPLDFNEGWEKRLRTEIMRDGKLHPIFSIDYFVFSKDQYRQMPDFVIGRPQWDNWMIYHAREQGWPVVDVTTSVMAVHQNHDYRHLPGGKPPHGLEEGRRNRQFAGGERAKRMIIDADKRLVDGTLRSHPFTLMRAIRRLEVWLLKRRWFGLEWRVIRVVRGWRKSVSEPLPEGWMAGGLTRQSASDEKD